MRQFFSGSLLRTVVFIIIVSALPALGIVVLTGVERNKAATERAVGRSVGAVHAVAQAQKSLTAGVHTLLMTLAQREAVHKDAAELSEFYSYVADMLPAYSDIFAANNEGLIIAAGKMPPEPVRVRDRQYYNRALASNGFSAGDVVFSRLSNRPLIHFAYKTEDTDQKPMVVVAGLLLNYYPALLKDLHIPPGAQIFITDQRGTIAFPPPDKPENIRYLPREIQADLSRRKELMGVSALNTQQGRLSVVFEQLTLPESDLPYMRVVLTMPESAMFADASAQLGRDLLLFFLTFATISVVAWMLVRKTLSPVKRLLSAADRFSRGDYSEKPDITSACREFAGLADAMTEMSGVIEKRETDLITAKEHAQAAGKSKSEFLANMSHEIRTPMNAVIGMAYLSLKGELTSQQRGYMTKIHEAGSDLLRVINDILELSKIDAGKLGMESIAFTLRDIFAENQRRFSRAARGKRVALSFSVASNVPKNLIGDPLRIGQVLGHLLDNAVRYTDSGSVTVTAELFDTLPQGVVVAVKVEDTGKGLTDAQLTEFNDPTLADPQYMPEKSAGSSSGLGILLCHRLVAMMQGTLFVKSTLGAGSTFTFTIPLGSRASARAGSAKILSNIKVLAIDDDTVSLNLLEELLKGFGMMVTTEEFPQKALGRIQEADAAGESFHLAIVDWRMPEIDGIEVTRRIKQEMRLNSTPAVVMLSAYGWEGITLQAEQAGADAFLHKPINESVLLDTIMTMLKLKGTSTMQISLADRDDLSGRELVGLRILLVEDNPINQQIAREILEEAGLKVTTANHGQEALALCDPLLLDAPFDIVLTDLQMPIMDGFKTARRIRALPVDWAPTMPIIAMTAQSRDAEFAACLEAGINDHASKPIALAELFDTLRRWMPLAAVTDTETSVALQELARLLLRESPEADLLLLRSEHLLEPVLHEGRLQIIRQFLEKEQREQAAAFLMRLNKVLQFMDKG